MRQLEIISGTFSIELVERCDIRSPSQKWRISIAIGSSEERGAFQGQIEAWFFNYDLAEFLEQLRECERTRRGEVRLEAMSSEEFQMRIFNSDSSGHFGIEFSINYESFGFGARLYDRYAYDPSLLPQLIRKFEQFLDNRQEDDELLM